MLRKMLFDIMVTLVGMVYSLGEINIMEKIYERYENVFEKYEDKYPNGFICICLGIYFIAYIPYIAMYYIVKDKIEKK